MRLRGGVKLSQQSHDALLISEIVRGFLQSLTNGDNWRQIPGLGDDRLLIKKVESTYQLWIGLNDPIPEWYRPEWIDIRTLESAQILTFSHVRYTELEYLVRKLLEGFNPTEDAVTQFLRTLHSQNEIWNLGREPLGLMRQRGLVGEISNLLYFLENGAPPTILAHWDISSSARIDVEIPGILHLELKSTASNSNTIEVSSVDQLKIQQTIPLFVGAVCVERVDEGGKNLAQIVQFFLRNVKDLAGAEIAIRLEAQLDAFYSIISLSRYFTTKWIASDQRVYEVEVDSPSNILSDVIPEGVDISSYSLELETLTQRTEIPWDEFGSLMQPNKSQ